MFEEILACCCISVRLSPENEFVGYSRNVVICLSNSEAASEGFLTLVIINLTEQTGNLNLNHIVSKTIINTVIFQPQ